MHSRFTKAASALGILASLALMSAAFGDQPYIDLATANNSTSTPPESVKVWGGNPGDVKPDSFDPANLNYDDTAFIDVDWPADISAGNPVQNYSYYWYRIKFKIPSSFQQYKGSALLLNHYNMDESDCAFVNGHFVGSTFSNASAVRKYLLPSDFLNWDGENLIAILGSQSDGTAGSTKTAGYVQVADPTVGYVYGKVVTETGAGATAMYVYLTPASGGAIQAKTSIVDGSFRFLNVTPGTYAVSLKGMAKSLPTVSNVTVAAGSVTIVPDLTIQGTGSGPSDLTAVDPTQLKGEDINTEGGDDSYDKSAGIYTIDSDGADIWDVADAFHYLYLPTPISGDFTAAVRVLDVAEGASDWSKAGIMARESLDPGSPQVNGIGSWMHGPHLQWRAKQDATSNNLDLDIWFQLGSYIILSRKADTFRVFRSLDGSQAEQVFGQNVAGFPKQLYIGLAATSHASGSVETAKFSDFKISPTAFAPATITSPSGVTLGDLNGDGKINVQDATLSLRIAVGLLTPTDDQNTAADANKDGKTNIQDTTLILQVAVGIKSGF